MALSPEAIFFIFSSSVPLRSHVMLKIRLSLENPVKYEHAKWAYVVWMELE